MIREPGETTTIISPLTDFGLDMLQIRSPETSIEVLGHEGIKALADRVEQVTLRNNPIPGYYPYLGCEVELIGVELANICPSALYVLKDNLERTIAIREALLQEGIDILTPTNDIATITIRVSDIGTGQSEVYSINPMLAETSPYDPGNPTILFDGLHRAAVARLLGIETVNLFLIKEPHCPLQPLPVDWSEINVWETVPPNSMKKRFRFQSQTDVVLHQTSSWAVFRRGFISLEAERNHMFSLFGQHPDLCEPLATWVSGNWEMYFEDLPPSEERAWALPLIQRYPQSTKEISGIIAENWDKLRSGMSPEEELLYLFNILYSHPNVKLVRWIMSNFDELRIGFSDATDIQDFFQNAILKHLTLDFSFRLKILAFLKQASITS